MAVRKEGQAHALRHNKRRRDLHRHCRINWILAATGRTAGSYVLHSYIYPAGCWSGGGTRLGGKEGKP